MELAKAGLDELLSFERRLVFRVLTEISKSHRLRDGLRKEDVELVAKLVDFLAQLVAHFTYHDFDRTYKKTRPRKGMLSGSNQQRAKKIPPLGEGPIDGARK